MEAEHAVLRVSALAGRQLVSVPERKSYLKLTHYPSLQSFAFRRAPRDLLTPEMVAKLTDHIWTIEDVLAIMNRTFAAGGRVAAADLRRRAWS